MHDSSKRKRKKGKRDMTQDSGGHIYTHTHKSTTKTEPFPFPLIFCWLRWTHLLCLLMLYFYPCTGNNLQNFVQKQTTQINTIVVCDYTILTNLHTLYVTLYIHNLHWLMFCCFFPFFLWKTKAYTTNKTTLLRSFFTFAAKQKYLYAKTEM